MQSEYLCVTNACALDVHNHLNRLGYQMIIGADVSDTRVWERQALHWGSVLPEQEKPVASPPLDCRTAVLQQCVYLLTRQVRPTPCAAHGINDC